MATTAAKATAVTGTVATILTICLTFCAFNPVVVVSEVVEMPVMPDSAVEFPYHVTSAVRSLHEDVFTKFYDKIVNEALFFNGNDARAKAPLEFKSPEELKNLFNFTIGHKRADHNSLLEDVSKIIRYSPKASHPYKVDSHSVGLDPYALVADFMGSVTGMPLTFMFGPVQTLMEFEVGRALSALIGYPENKGETMIAPGTGFGTGLSIHAAFHYKFPGFKFLGIKGLGSPKAVLFLSEDAATSYNKECMWTGLGINGCIRVRTDDRGRMNTTDLEEKIKISLKKGETPFMIIASAGTPILGSIDPIDKIVKVAQKYGNLWVHVDGVLAGSNFLSKKLKHTLKGLEKSDSFLWSTEKALGTPFSSVVFVTRHEELLKQLEDHAAYAFHDSLLYNVSRWDHGDGTIQCTRRPEVVKIWFLWKAKGLNRLQNHIDDTHNLTSAATAELKRRNASFELILDEFESSQISFYYIPKGIRHLSKELRERALKSSKYTENLRALLIREGTMLISVNFLPEAYDRPPFLVMNLQNSALGIADINYLFDQIEFYGEDDLVNHIIKHAVRDFKAQGSKSVQHRPKPPPAPSSFPDYVSSPIEAQHKEFIQAFFQLLLQNYTFFTEGAEKHNPAYLFTTPEELLQLFDVSLANTTRGVGIMEEKGGHQALLNIVGDIFKYSGQFGHPYWAFMLLQGVDPYTVMADVLLASINSPMLTYEDSPILTLMEQSITRLIRQRVGYIKPDEPDDTYTINPESAGIVVNGGSASIQTAHVMAYFKKVPHAKEFGNLYEKKQLVSFLSANGHYASHKAAMLRGMGENSCIRVPTDDRGRMTGAALRGEVLKAISEGKIPFFVVATMGTTVLGAQDFVDEIADVCEEFGMWLHADGSFGGALIFSQNETRRLERYKGIERTDSFNMNLNKGFASTRECSILVTKEKDAFKRSLANDLSSLSDDLDNPELCETDLDPSKRSLIHERRASVLKAWMMFKAKGLEGLSQNVEQRYNLVHEAMKEIESRGDAFLLALPTFQTLNIDFDYVPPRLRHLDKHCMEFRVAVNLVQAELQKIILVKHSILIAVEPVGGADYLIFSFVNSAVSIEDVKYMLDLIEYYGKDL